MKFSTHQAAGGCELCRGESEAGANLHCAWCGYTGDTMTEFLLHISGACGAAMADNLMRYYDANKDERDRRRTFRRRRRR
jgi:hypothetical protein